MRRTVATLALLAAGLAAAPAHAGAPAASAPPATSEAKVFETVYVVGHVQAPAYQVLPTRQDVTTAATVAVQSAPLLPKVEQSVALPTF